MLKISSFNTQKVILVLGGLVTGCLFFADFETGKTEPVKPTSSVPNSFTVSTERGDVRSYALKKLLEGGWTSDAAIAVVDRSLHHYFLLFEEDRKQLDKSLSVLARLGGKKYVLQKLVEMPHLAGLLAGALEQDPEGPEIVLGTIPNGVMHDRVISLFALSATPSDCLALAKTLQLDRAIILRLCERDLFGATDWFAFRLSDDTADTVYRQWVRTVWDEALNDTDEEALDRANALLTIHAPVIREYLENDPDFRQHFLTKYWGEFMRIVNKQTDDAGWGIYVREPRVWDFFRKFDENDWQVFSTYGPVAVDLLLAEEYRDCSKQVLQAMKVGDEQTFISLQNSELRKYPLFVKLLKRNLPGGTLAKALHMLESQSGNSTKLLSQWDDFSDNTLIEELGPPPDGPQTWLPGYNLYNLGRKYSQGRGVTGMDWVFAAVDTVEIVFMAKGAGKGLKNIQRGLIKDLEKRGSRKVAGNVSQMSSRQLSPWVLREGYHTARMLSRPIRGAADVDVTKVVQFVFQNSKLGRETFKQLTGLEARVFMRADRRIAIDLNSLVQKNHLIGRALRETAVNGGFDLSLKTELGKSAAESIITKGITARDISAKQIQAWREHLAIWWMASSDGSLIGDQSLQHIIHIEPGN